MPFTGTSTEWAIWGVAGVWSTMPLGVAATSSGITSVSSLQKLITVVSVTGMETLIRL